MKPSELIDSPEKWTKGEYARDASGKSIDFSSNDAQCFCLRGAIYRLGDDNDECRQNLHNLSRAVARLYPQFWGVTSFNDHPETTFEDVQKVLKEAGL
jgi:hypothetical protein